MSGTGAKIIHSMLTCKEYEAEGFKLFSINLSAFWVITIQIYWLISITCGFVVWSLEFSHI